MGGLLNSRRLNNTNILSIILSGMFEGSEKRVYCEDLRGQLESTLYGAIEHPLIRWNPEEGIGFHFATEGAYPWSRDFRDAYWVLQMSCTYMGWLSPGHTDYVDSQMKNLAELIRKETKISDADYDFLQNLGKQIEVSERISSW